jgi:hypothetical protein
MMIRNDEHVDSYSTIRPEIIDREKLSAIFDERLPRAENSLSVVTMNKTERAPDGLAQLDT